MSDTDRVDRQGWNHALVELLSVGEVAARLGVSTSTVRMWGSRYGLTASARSTGGHRRFTRADVAALEQVHRAVISGVDPAAAAAAATGRDPGELAGRRGGPGGAVLSVPGAAREARGLARAASRLDSTGVEEAVLAKLESAGTPTAWDEMLRPVLVAAGQQWEQTGAGIEVEHLLTSAVTAALVRHTGRLPHPPADRPVLLAGGPRDDHVLPLLAVRAALAERGVPSRLLGPRTPVPVLAAAARRTRAAAALVWLSLPDGDAVAALPELAGVHRRMRVYVSGPGWDGADVGTAVRTTTLDEAVAALKEIWAGGGAGQESPR